MMFLRVHYPLNYWTVLLSNASSLEDIKEYYLDAKKHQINILTPNFYHSSANFSITDHTIY
jgi:DNA polymerase III alpha subunit